MAKKTKKAAPVKKVTSAKKKTSGKKAVPVKKVTSAKKEDPEVIEESVSIVSDSHPADSSMSSAERKDLEKRIDLCIEKYPDFTRAEAKHWLLNNNPYTKVIKRGNVYPRLTE